MKIFLFLCFLDEMETERNDIYCVHVSRGKRKYKNQNDLFQKRHVHISTFL